MKPLAAYRSRVTPKMRRLRTMGLLIIVCLLLMVLYGSRVLMPRTIASVHLHSAAARGINPAAVHMHHVLVVQVLFAIAYWSVCGLLLIGLFVIAWLDVREVTRQYLYDRTTLVIQAAEEMKHRLDRKTDENQ